MKIQNVIVLESESLGGNDIQLRDSQGGIFKSHDPIELLSWIARHAGEGWLLTWDLNRFLQPLFRVLPSGIVCILNNGERAKWPPFKMLYGVSKGRFFGVDFKDRNLIHDNLYSEHKYEATIYQLSTWYAGETSASIEDTQAKAVRLLATLGRMGMEPESLTSPASVFEQSILRKLPMPTIFSQSESWLPFHESALNYIREWRSIFQIGIWESGCYDYDLSGCYSHIISELPNITGAELVHTTDGSIPPGVAWGLLKGTLNVTADIHPFVDADGLCRTGAREDFISLPELDLLGRGLGTFKATEGWFIRLRRNYKIFAYTMQKLYGFRNGKDELADNIAKSMANSLWGKWHQFINGDPAEFSNFIYAAWVASEARLLVYEFIVANQLQDSIVSVTVDGCLATKSLAISTARSFGNWRVNPEGAALVLSANHQWYGPKKPNGKTAIEMINIIKTHPRSTMLGDISLATLEHDRYFEKLPKNGRDLLNNAYRSKPFTAKEV
jgi:hypothetical protein